MKKKKVSVKKDTKKAQPRSRAPIKIKKEAAKKPDKKKGVPARVGTPKRGKRVEKVRKGDLCKQDTEIRRLDTLILKYLRQKKDLTTAEEFDLENLIKQKKELKKSKSKGVVYKPVVKKLSIEEEYIKLGTYQFWEISRVVESLPKEASIEFSFESFREIFEFVGVKAYTYSGKTKVKGLYITLFSIIAKIGQTTDKESEKSRDFYKIRFVFSLFQKVVFSTGEIAYKLIGEYMQVR